MQLNRDDCFKQYRIGRQWYSDLFGRNGKNLTRRNKCYLHKIYESLDAKLSFSSTCVLQKWFKNKSQATLNWK